MKDLSLHILDIAENSTTAGATLIHISINENEKDDLFSIDIEDNGKGMSVKELESASDPFYSTRETRKIGLGLPLFRQAVEQCDGKFTIQSQQNMGTTIHVEYPLTHIDRKPLGDIAGVIIQLVCSFPKTSFVYEHTTNFGTFAFDSKEVKEMLGNVTVSENKIRTFLKEMIHENLQEINVKD